MAIPPRTIAEILNDLARFRAVAPPTNNTNEDPQPLPPMCVFCYDSFPASRIYTAPCSHTYHDDCLADIFYKTKKDGAHRLPHCCDRNMDLDGVLPHLPADLADFFRSKREELEDGRRKYCHVPTCSTYIPPSGREGDVGLCRSCQARTCLLCNKAAHPGTECEVDEELKRMLETVEEKGWRRCEACGRVVELNGGCNHVTCACGAQFCYRCGAPWKTCACILNDNRGAVLEGAVYVPPFRDRACQHPRMARVRGRQQVCGRCEESMRRYIFLCAGCGLRVCRRCRYGGPPGGG